MSLENLKPLAIELGDVIEEIRSLTERKKELELQLRPALAAKGNMQFGSYTFNVTTSPGRKTLDKKLLEEAGIDLEPFYKIGAPYSTMKCTKVEVV